MQIERDLTYFEKGAKKIRVILENEFDFNVALDLVAVFLSEYEPNRLKIVPLSIEEILVLKNYHISVWKGR